MKRALREDDIRTTLIEDENILVRPVTETMALFSATYAQVRSARSILTDNLVEKYGFEKLYELRERRLQQNVFYRLKSVEKRYPNILSNIVRVRPLRGKSGFTYKSIADNYGLSKQRISQIRDLIVDAAQTFGMTKEEIVKDVTDEFRKKRKKKSKKNA